MSSSPVHPKSATSSFSEQGKNENEKTNSAKSVSATEKAIASLVNRPFVALGLVVVLAGFCCIGLHKFEMEKRIDKLWIEEGSAVKDEIDYEDDHKYKTSNSDTQLATLIPLNDPDHNVMTRNLLDKQLKMAENVRDISFEHNGHTYGYQDVCASVSKYRVACQRVTVLDCFKEGAFDFPPYNAIYALQGVLNAVADTVASTVLLTLGVDGAVGQVEAGMQDLVEAGMIEQAEDGTVALTESTIVSGTEDVMVQQAIDGMVAQAEAGLVAGAEASLVQGGKDGTVAAAEQATIGGTEDTIYASCDSSCRTVASAAYPSLSERDASITYLMSAGGVTVDTTQRGTDAYDMPMLNYAAGAAGWTITQPLNSTSEEYERFMIQLAGYDPDVDADFLNLALSNSGLGSLIGQSGTTAYNEALQTLALQSTFALTATQSITDLDAVTYQNVMLDVALNEVSPGATLSALGGIDGQAFKDVALDIAIQTVTTGMLTLAGLGDPTGDAYISFMLDAYFASLGAPGSPAPTVASLGGRDGTAFKEMMISTGFLASFNVSVTNDLGGFGSDAYNQMLYSIGVEQFSQGTLALSDLSTDALYNDFMIDVAVQTLSGGQVSLSNLLPKTSQAYVEFMIDVALSQFGASIAQLGGRGTDTYNTAVEDISVQVAFGGTFATMADLRANEEAYNVYMLTSYWGVASAPISAGGCGVNASTTFTTVDEFYQKFVEAGCPTVGSDGCSLNGGCVCEDNLGGITPYSARPSFYDADTDLAEYLSDTCYMWDNGAALPAVPQKVVIGKPSGPEGLLTANGNEKFDKIEAYEYVLYTDSPEAFAMNIAKRPYDPHQLTVDEAKDILYMWEDLFMDVVPQTVSSQNDDDACNAMYTSKRNASIAAANCKNCEGAHEMNGMWMPCASHSTGGVVSEDIGFRSNAFATKAFDDVIDDASTGAEPLLVIGIVLIFLYAFVTTGFTLLSLGGVCLVIFGVIAGLGASLWLGVVINPTTINVLPFLMLGLGVDDMFLVIRTLLRIASDPATADLPAERLVAESLQIAGPSVTLTTFANFCAFLIGTLTPLPVVQEFAKSAAICTVCMYFTDLVGFSALCVVAFRHFRSSKKVEGKESKESFVERNVVPFLTNMYARCAIIVVFVALLIVCALGIDKIKMGLNLKQVAKKGTQYYEFIETRYDFFGFYPNQISAYETDFSVPAIQEAYLDAVGRVYDIKYNEKRVDSWLRQFLDWADEDECVVGGLTSACGSDMVPACAVNSVTGFFDAGADEFMRCLNAWNNANTVTSSPRFFPLSNQGMGSDTILSPIEYCEVPYYSQELWETSDYVDLIDGLRDLFDEIESESGLRLFPTGYLFAYWEQYRNLWKHLINNLIVAVACTFVIGTIAIFTATTGSAVTSITPSKMMSQILYSMHGSFVMILCIVSTMVMLLGFMGYAEIQMSAIPALTVIACIGICVDLQALVTLFFCQGKGDRNARIKYALWCVFIPTLDSMSSTIVGCLALGFSVIELYVWYFFAMFVAVAVLGTLNGLLLLPTLLSLIGPPEFVVSTESGARIAPAVADV